VFTVPTSSLAFLLAPFLSRSLATARWPLSTAIRNAVRPA
jgi:hypothetical protein